MTDVPAPTDKDLAASLKRFADLLHTELGWMGDGELHLRNLHLAAQRLTAPLPDEVTDAPERSARDAKMVRECNASLGKRIAELEDDLKQHQELNAAEHKFMLEAKAEAESLSSLLLTARENEKALGGAVAKREEEAMALTRVAEGFRKALRKTCEALEWAGHDDDDPACPPCAAYAQARALLGETEEKG